MMLVLRQACGAQESLRMRPPVSGTMRTPVHNLRLGPYTLPAGTLININLGVMGNSALNYASPELYLPARLSKHPTNLLSHWLAAGRVGKSSLCICPSQGHVAMTPGKQGLLLQQERWEEPGAEYARPVSKSTARALRINAGSAGIATAGQHQVMAGAEAVGCQLSGRPADAADEKPASGGRPVKRYIPYSLGSQDCVGQNLARHSVPAALAMLFSHFSFRLAAEARHSGLCLRAVAEFALHQPPCVCMEHVSRQQVLL